MSARKKIPAAVRVEVAHLAAHRCSYCRSPEQVGVPMVVDHIIPLAAGGSSTIDNLCLACYRCNEFKGAKQVAIDPVSGENTPLFNPRTQQWRTHFAWSQDGLHIIGLTSIGRTTIESLRLNNEKLRQARQIWLLVGLHPPLV